MANRKSRVQGFGDKNPFPLNRDLVTLNTFITLGSSSAGRTHVALFYKETLDWGTLYVDPDSNFEYSPEIVHRYIKSIEGYVIGSLFDLSNRHSDITPLRISVIDRSEEHQDFASPNENGHAGVIVYSNAEGSFLVIPTNSPESTLTVQVD